MNRYCYGKDYGRHAECRRCDYKRWCATAKEPPLLRNRMGEYNEELGQNPEGTLCHPADFSDAPRQREEENTPKKAERVYTHKELCCVIASIMELNYDTLVMLSERLHDPMLSMQGLARRCGITRQTVYQRIRSCCRKNPEFRDIFGVEARPSLKKK